MYIVLIIHIILAMEFIIPPMAMGLIICQASFPDRHHHHPILRRHTQGTDIPTFNTVRLINSDVLEVNNEECIF